MGDQEIARREPEENHFRSERHYPCRQHGYRDHRDGGGPGENRGRGVARGGRDPAYRPTVEDDEPGSNYFAALDYGGSSHRILSRIADPAGASAYPSARKIRRYCPAAKLGYESRVWQRRL